MAEASVVKKITVKTVCGRLEKPTENKIVMRLFGQANGKQAGQSNLGEYVAVLGTFEAINTTTGEAMRSGRAILPPLVTDLIIGQLTDKGTVQFALDIGIKPSTSPVGYDYFCKPLIDSGDSDPLSALKKQVASAETKPEEKPADKPAADKPKGK